MKNVAIGRKAWLFVGSTLAGERAANLMSLIASCKANRVEPWAYRRDIFLSPTPRHQPPAAAPRSVDHRKSQQTLDHRRPKS